MDSTQSALDRFIEHTEPTEPAGSTHSPTPTKHDTDLTRAALREFAIDIDDIKETRAQYRAATTGSEAQQTKRELIARSYALVIERKHSTTTPEETERLQELENDCLDQLQEVLDSEKPLSNIDADELRAQLSDDDVIEILTRNGEFSQSAVTDFIDATTGFSTGSERSESNSEQISLLYADFLVAMCMIEYYHDRYDTEITGVKRASWLVNILINIMSFM